MNTTKHVILSAFLVLFSISGNASASNHLNSSMAIESMSVSLYKSHIVSLDRPIKKISVGNPDIADILIMKSREVYVLGKALGTTNVLLWDSNGTLVKAFDVEVTHDLRVIREKLHEYLPDETIDVSTSQGAIILNGHVSNMSAMDTAYQVAKSFAMQDKAIKNDGGSGDQPGVDVINLLSIGDSQQVMLKVTIAEMQRSLIKKWDMRFKSLFVGSDRWTMGGVNGGAAFPDAVFASETIGGGLESDIFQAGNGIVGPAISEFQASPMTIDDKGLFASFLSDDFFFMFSLEAAKNTGLAKILAEPTLTTLTGQDASFISGGEFPIPVNNGDDGITVQYKDFGVGVNFLPTVLSNDRIHLDLNLSVTEISTANAVFVGVGGTNSTYVIPGLTKRSAQSSVELADGQTIAIAGLMNENMRDLVSKFPLLGDLPIIGSLFRSKDFQKGETELVILVTPTLAKPIDRTSITLPTDGYVEPNDLEFYLMGKTIQKAAPKKQTKTTADTENSEPTEQAEYKEAGMNMDNGVSSGQFGHVIYEK